VCPRGRSPPSSETGSGSPGVRYGDPLGEDDAVGRAAAGVVVGHDVQCAAVVVAEHAREAPAVGVDRVQHLAAFSHPCAALPGTLAYQMAPSASAQMPSGADPAPSSAHTRRSTSSPESAIVHAVSRSACDSASTSVSSPRTTIPLGNQTSSATWWMVPSASTTFTVPGFGSSHGIEPGMSTHARPAASTTISLKGCPVAPYGSKSGPATIPRGVLATSRPSGSQSIENGSPSTRATTSRFPSASKTSTSPASQSHIQNRPSCHRGDSPIWIPVANTSVMPEQTPAAATSHRSSAAAPTRTRSAADR
jgi:hypothetical protein